MRTVVHQTVVHRFTLALSTLCMAAFAHAQTPSAPGAQVPQPPARGPSLDLALEAAKVAVENCIARDQKIGVSVLDSAGVTKVVLASDGASPRGVQSGTAKAVTALAFRLPSSQVGEQIKTDKELADKVAANTSYNARAGAVLLKVNDEIIGAIGVGGARGSENDEACALAGAQKIQARLK